MYFYANWLVITFWCPTSGNFPPLVIIQATRWYDEDDDEDGDDDDDDDDNDNDNNDDDDDDAYHNHSEYYDAYARWLPTGEMDKVLHWYRFIKNMRIKYRNMGMKYKLSAKSNTKTCVYIKYK